MIGRRWLLLFSFLLTLALHAVLWWLAPDLVILRHNAVSARISDRIQVRLIEDFAPPSEESPINSSLQSRPGSVRDMLDLEAMAQPDELPDREGAEVPELTERLSTPIRERRHDLQPDHAALRAQDERILAISAEDARRELQVARRLVRGDDTDFSQLAERPAVEGTIMDEGGLRLGFDLPSVALLDQPLQGLDDLLPTGGVEPARVAADTPSSSAPPEEGAAAAEQRVVTSLTEERRAGLRAEAESRATILDDQFAVTLSIYKPAEERLGYFQVQLAPRPDVAIEVLPKEILFIIDASSSIAPQKLRNFARGVSDALTHLRPEDSFNIQIFRDTATYFRETPIPGNAENVAAARAWISELEARGKTDFYEALLPAVNQEAPSGYPRIILVLTDGRPTKGVTDGRTIINGVTADNLQRSTIFAVSGGNTVNQPLLDLLAYRNRGSTQYSGDLEAIQTDLSAFVATLSEPVMVEMAGDFSGVGQEELYPRLLPDLYKGRPYEIYGRFDPNEAAPFALRITGKAGESKREIAFRVDLDAAIDGGPEVARRWAFQKIYFLIGEISRLGESPERIAEIRELSRRFNIRTSYDE